MCVNIEEIFRSVENFVKDNLLEINNRRFDVSYKEDGSPVTSADIFVERSLSALLASFLPNINFIGEESYSAQNPIMHSGFLAVLDPIDGTENFCSGLKEWGVSLGIWHNGKHLGSMLMMPELNELIVTGAPPRRVRSRITGFSSSYVEEISTGIRNSIEYRVTGCAVYNLINVIRGSFSRFVNPKGAYIWDLLPGLMLALENGCEVLLDDEVYDGKLLDPSRKYRVDIRHRYDLHSGQGT